MINSQLLLYLNLGFGVLLVLYFVVGRSKPKQPTKLNLRASESEDSLKSQNWLEPEATKPLKTNIKTDYALATVKDISNMGVKNERNLSVLFMYNGHDWEAHDVLGAPQGASMHLITEIYQKLIRNADVGSLAFYEQAYNALSDHHRKHRL